MAMEQGVARFRNVVKDNLKHENGGAKAGQSGRGNGPKM